MLVENSDVKQTVTVTPEVTNVPSEEPTEEPDTVEKGIDYLSLTDSELLSLSSDKDVDFTYCVKIVNKKGAGTGLSIVGIEKSEVFAGFEASYDYSVIVFPTKVEDTSLPVNVSNTVFSLSKHGRNEPYSYSTDEEAEYVYCKDFDDLKLVVIPSTVYLIDDGYFVDCKSLERVVLGSNVNEIGASAFQGCTSLKIINFPKNLEVIESSAFDDCDSLENIVVVKNSYGEDYCKENNLPYSYIDGSFPSDTQESEPVIGSAIIN